MVALDYLRVRQTRVEVMGEALTMSAGRAEAPGAGKEGGAIRRKVDAAAAAGSDNHAHHSS